MASNQNPGMAMLPGSSTDFDVQGAAIARRRAVAEAMLKKAQQGMGEGQMISGRYIAPHWSEGLSQLYGAYKGTKDLKSADEDQTKLGQDYNSGLGEAIRKHFQTQEGTPAAEIPNSAVEQSGPMPTAEGQGLPMPLGNNQMSEAVAPDRRKAMVEAMTSQFKPMQELGKAEFAQSGKQTMTPKDYLMAGDSFSSTSKSAAAQAASNGHPNPASFLLPASKVTAVGGKAVSHNDSGTSSLSGDFSDQFDAPVKIPGPNGELLVQKNKSTGQYHSLANGQVINVGGKVDNELAVDFGKKAISRLETSYADSKNANSAFDRLSAIKTMLPDLHSGAGANFVQAINKGAQMLGIPNDGSAATQEMVKAGLAKEVAGVIKQFGPGITNEERKYTEVMEGANPMLEPDAIERAVNLGLARSLNTVTAHKQDLAKISKLQGITPEMISSLDIAHPKFDLNSAKDEFDWDLRPEGTGMLSVKSGAGRGIDPRTGQPGVSSKGAGSQGSKPVHTMTKAEIAAETAALKAKLGIQ